MIILIIIPISNYQWSYTRNSYQQQYYQPSIVLLFFVVVVDKINKLLFFSHELKFTPWLFNLEYGKVYHYNSFHFFFMCDNCIMLGYPLSLFTQLIRIAGFSFFKISLFGESPTIIIIVISVINVRRYCCNSS